MIGNGSMPSFKRMFYVRSLPGGVLRIGEAIPNRSVEIEDVDGWIERLLRLMDGTRTVESLARETSLTYPAMSVEEVKELIAELDRLGYVDDRRLLDESSLRPEELDRYQANLNYFSYFSHLNFAPWSMQESLRNAKVTVIGAGALGCGVLFNLAGLGVGAVRIVDFDVIELSNLNRQFLYNEQDIGRRKIEAASDVLTRFHSGMTLELTDLEIKSAADAKRVILGSDLVVLAADQPYWLLERWVNEACSETRIPFIAGGMNVCEGQVYAVVPDRTGCVACIDAQYGRSDANHASFIAEFRAADYRMPSTSIMPNYMMLAGMVSGDIARWFTGTAAMRSEGKVIAMNFDSYQLETRIDFTRKNLDCPVCGESA
ncbi:HesA/MoeB/ThiF family protein [Cohnella cholangitidis]|uniref:ThiF family adenylyltransferase n=1 Tax=Cohnella cholangitidis TaxID=2598458 RepID=A0A7G5C6E3_9BACL|nr:ThiF family adenylyltransferase [Cohnella cholangitidis]QMV44777.1 ThiF family adenylyltransferase [Cohnella cholangitidis]